MVKLFVLDILHNNICIFFIGMLSGLKKMVGKNNSPISGTDIPENHLLSMESTHSLYTPSLKAGKKRKVDAAESTNVKRKYG